MSNIMLNRFELHYFINYAMGIISENIAITIDQHKSEASICYINVNSKIGNNLK